MNTYLITLWLVAGLWTWWQCYKSKDIDKALAIVRQQEDCGDVTDAHILCAKVVMLFLLLTITLTLGLIGAAVWILTHKEDN